MRTLVLNAGYEPLAVVTFRRALILVLAGKASVLAEDAEPVVGPNDVMSRPSVILLDRHVRPPYAECVAVSRRGVLRRDDHRCGYCGKSASTVDHIQPRSRGGPDRWENLVACCLKCDNVKGNYTPAEMGWSLRVSPAAPRGGHWQIRELERPKPAWGAFLGYYRH